MLFASVAGAQVSVSASLASDVPFQYSVEISLPPGDINTTIAVRYLVTGIDFFGVTYNVWGTAQPVFHGQAPNRSAIVVVSFGGKVVTKIEWSVTLLIADGYPAVGTTMLRDYGAPATSPGNPLR
jgi:hypothetical protein